LTGEIAARCEIVGGDFFDSVPAGADAYLLKGVIHDWPDDDAVRILRNVRRAIPADGTLLLVERSIPAARPAGLGDLLMLVIGGATGVRRNSVLLEAAVSRLRASSRRRRLR
jgi:hypothetical protein